MPTLRRSIELRLKFAHIMEAAVKFAIAAPYPSVDEVEKHVYA